MSLFKPPPNTLAPYQRELLTSVFREAWAEIVPKGYRLPRIEKYRLQNKVSERLCTLAAKGVVDPWALRVLTVATIKVDPRYRRRRVSSTAGSRG
jgi:hypothetical protein